MTSWQLQEAKASFSEFLESALKKVRKLSPAEGLKRLRCLFRSRSGGVCSVKAAPTSRSGCWAKGPRFEDIVPKRGGWKSRPAIDFSGPEFKSAVKIQ